MSEGNLIYLNGKLVEEDKAKVSVFDRGFLYGDGIFETMRTYEGNIFCLEDHLNRLFQSAELIKFKLPWSMDWLKEAVLTTLKANKIKDDVLLRLTVTRGTGPGGIDLSTDLEPTIVIMLKSLLSLPTNDFEKGRRAAIVSVRRNGIESLNPAAKTLNFLNNILAKAEADELGADEAIILNNTGKVTEGTVSNIFAVINGEIRTPPISDGLLPGISRKAVINLAKEHNLKLREASLYPEDLYRAEELFLTSTSVGIIAVTWIDGRMIGSGRAGDISKKLFIWFKQKVREA